MKISMESLVRGLAAAKRVIPSIKTPRKILWEARLYERGGEPRLCATDLERGIDVALVGDAEKGEEVLLPVSEAAAALATIEDERVDVTRDAGSGHVTLRSDTARWSWSTGDPADFPGQPQGKRAVAATLPRGRLRSGIERVIWAVAEDGSRYALNYMHLVVKEGGAVLLEGTDGKCLCRDEFPGGTSDADALFEPQAALALLDVVGSEGEVELAVDDFAVKLRVGGSVGWAIASSVKFPPTDRIVPKVEREPSRVDGTLLAAAVKRASLATVKESRALRLTHEAGALLVSTHNSVKSGDGGRVPHQGAPQEEVLVSADYLKKALAGVEGELSMWVGDGLVVFRAASREGWVAIVMPMTIG